MQQQGSVWISMAHGTTKGHLVSLDWAAAWGLVDVQGLGRAGPTPPLGSVGELTLMQHSERVPAHLSWAAQ